jgi:hypothetical protein
MAHYYSNESTAFWPIFGKRMGRSRCNSFNEPLVTAELNCHILCKYAVTLPHWCRIITYELRVFLCLYDVGLRYKWFLQYRTKFAGEHGPQFKFFTTGNVELATRFVRYCKDEKDLKAAQDILTMVTISKHTDLIPLQ